MCWLCVVDAKVSPPLYDLGIHLVNYFSKELDVIGINMLPRRELNKKDLGSYEMTALGIIFITGIREDIVVAALLDALNYEQLRLRNSLNRRD